MDMARFCFPFKKTALQQSNDRLGMPYVYTSDACEVSLGLVRFNPVGIIDILRNL
jgi:hypothetical protein